MSPNSRLGPEEEIGLRRYVLVAGSGIEVRNGDSLGV